MAHHRAVVVHEGVLPCFLARPALPVRRLAGPGRVALRVADVAHRCYRALHGGSAMAELSACFLVARGEGTPLPTSCPARLVITGPYRYIRNPMATGSLMQGIAIGVWLGSPLILLYVALGISAWNFLARPWEERDLEARFGPAYAHYRAQVRCWIPRLRPYSP